MFNAVSLEALLLVPVLVLLVLQIILMLRSSTSGENKQDLQSIERFVREGIDSVRREQQEEFARSRQEQVQALGDLRAELMASQRENRSELGNSFKTFEDSRRREVHEQQEFQRSRFSDLVAAQDRVRIETAATLDKIRDTVELRLASLQEQNAAKLEEMRVTVDEKLQATLEKRLSESFRQVSERLQKVHEGLGEMKSLATGVGDLKKVLSNVKTRGVLGEMQLQNILASLLSPEQFDENIATREGSRERVEFAVRLPGKDDDGDVVLLPIDAKFPLESYYRLLEAGEKGDAALLKQASKEVETEIRRCAKEISDKYLNPLVRPISEFCFFLSRGCLPKSFAIRHCLNSFRESTILLLPARQRLPHCSTACRWASGRLRYRNVRARSGRFFRRSKGSLRHSAMS